jgi:hypothetical protein
MYKRIVHYFIDGYNLLFSHAWNYPSDNLGEMRQALIEELNTIASLLHVPMTIVFDAALQEDSMRRAHSEALEIIFSGHGESADDLLVDLIERAHEREKIILVTRDRSLARRAQAFRIEVEDVVTFLKQIKARVRKKKFKMKQKTLASESSPDKKHYRIKKEEKGQLPPLTDIEAWIKIFTKP